MNKKIIFFNGPPRSGKDTIVNELLKICANTVNIKFSNPLKTALPVFFGLTSKQLDDLEKDKEVPSELLLGRSWREVQILLSENWAKPIFGTQVFGNITLNVIKNSDKQLFLINLQKTVIHTVVDLMNSLVEANFEANKNFLYEIFNTRISNKINHTFNSDYHWRCS